MVANKRLKKRSDSANRTEVEHHEVADASHGVKRSRAECKKKAKSQKGSTLGCTSGLKWLLGNETSTDAFREQYFEHKPLHVKRSEADYYSEFGDLATPRDLFSLMDQGIVPVYRVNMFRCIDGSTKETPEPPPASVADVRRLFKEGWSIQWLQPQQEHDALARLVAVLESEFGSLVGVNAYLTPPGVQGLAPHWDDVEVFVLQLSGQKAWQLHSSTSALSLPPSAQTLPRFSSGDLPLESLSPAMARPVLNPGDLLYFPRGTIHYAPNLGKKQPSVHLTISTYQQQSLYDLTNKTFEDIMAKLWESDETLRRGLPWKSFATGSPSYPQLCASVSGLLRRAADAVDEEAKAAAAGGVFGEAGGGSIAGALSELGSDFVKHRMPPILDLDQATSGHIITPASQIKVIDPTALAIVEVPDSDDAKLLHCIGNSRRTHMMNHPAGPMEDGEENDDVGESGEEEENTHEQGEEEDATSDGDDDSEGGQNLSAEAASVLRELCWQSSGSPIAASNQSAGHGASSHASLASALLKAKVPDSSWSEVCGVFTQLAALGLVGVGSAAASNGSARGKTRTKKRKVGA